MLEVYVIEESAERRLKLVEKILSSLDRESENLRLIPRVNVLPLSPDEIKLHQAPNLCILGPQILRRELSDVAKIRKALPNTPILAWVDAQLEHLGIIEQLARLGVDDVISEHASAHEFLKKLVLLSRRSQKENHGSLVLVDSGKGGVGVTSIVASVGEALAAEGKKVVLMDLDVESQDLSRFLHVRPFVNENLQLLFDESRPVTKEYVNQCVYQVWEEEPNLFCIPPIPESDNFYSSPPRYCRMLYSILEILDEQFDVIIIDIASVRGSFLQTLYRLADKNIFVMNNDPATLYASVDRLRKIRKLLSPDTQLLVVDNGMKSSQLSRTLLQEEFGRVARVELDEWNDQSIPFCAHGSRWPGSGSTLFTGGKGAVKRGIESICYALGFSENKPKSFQSVVPKFFAGWNRHAFSAQSQAKKTEAIEAPFINPLRYSIGSDRDDSNSANSGDQISNPSFKPRIGLPAPLPQRGAPSAEVADLVGPASFSVAPHLSKPSDPTKGGSAESNTRSGFNPVSRTTFNEGSDSRSTSAAPGTPIAKTAAVESPAVAKAASAQVQRAPLIEDLFSEATFDGGSSSPAQKVRGKAPLANVGKGMNVSELVSEPTIS